MTRRINCSPPFPKQQAGVLSPQKTPWMAGKGERGGYDIRGSGNFGTPSAAWETRGRVEGDKNA